MSGKTRVTGPGHDVIVSHFVYRVRTASRLRPSRRPVETLQELTAGMLRILTFKGSLSLSEAGLAAMTEIVTTSTTD